MGTCNYEVTMKFNTEEFQWTDSIEITLALVCLVRAYGSQAKAADALGISKQYLNDVLSGRREIGVTLAEKFGLKPIRIFVPINKGDYKHVENQS